MSRGPDDVWYSPVIAGDDGNYGQPVRFDRTRDGYVGITQTTTDSSAARVLLTSEQMRALVKFVAGQRMRRWVKDGQRAKARAR